MRAASAIVARGDELFVIQDDTSFIARIRGDEITSIALPRGPGGRRRFEVALGNKLDKLVELAERITQTLKQHQWELPQG